ncbi:hypothetical protein GGR57DRAFT_502473 [Xylariaceae sp. FL1272]|nr:hypothetical protein GGR57DRAFT_502473 [Xylariaceae sp. FL1272]
MQSPDYNSQRRPNNNNNTTNKHRPNLPNINTSPQVSRARDIVNSYQQQQQQQHHHHHHLLSSPPVSRKHSGNNDIGSRSTSRGRPPVSSNGNSNGGPYRKPTSKASSEGSFLDNDSPVDSHLADYRSPPLRDSHDLSLPNQDFTRDSLLGNMLNSLDQFSLGHIYTPSAPAFSFGDDDGDGGDDPYGVPRHDTSTRSMTNTARGPAASSIMYGGSAVSTPHGHGHSHGHGHAYSYSSDFEGFDDAASKISSQFSRGRRSNSSSGFQSGLSRINSMRERSHPGALSSSNNNKRPAHSRGGKTSKSSSTGSFVDAPNAYPPQAQATARWAAQSSHGRSSSFDYGERPSLTSPDTWKSEPSNNTFLVDDYEAAPNPTVPGGPRRPAVPTAPPPPPTASSRNESEASKKGTRSRSGTNKTTQSRYGPSREAAPPLPPLDTDSAPAPHVGYEKSKEPVAPAPATAPVSVAKEKQGFFSRLFGGSKTTAAVAAATPSPTVEPVSVPPTLKPADSHSSSSHTKTQHIVSQTKPPSAPPTRDPEPTSTLTPTPAPTPAPPHVIQKKSSFFRRRKKSIAEPPMPPPPVPQLDLTKTQDRALPIPEPSPVSSLRQVMNPYLRGSNPPTPHDILTPDRRASSQRVMEAETRADSSRRTRGFSPEYEPSPSATIRTVKSTSALKNQSATRSSAQWRGPVDSPLRSPPGVPVKSPPSKADSTFLHDSSDEGESKNTPRQRQQERPQTGRAATASAVPKPKMSLEPLSPLGNVPIPERSPSLLLQKNTDGGDQTPTSLGVPLATRNNSDSRPVLSRSGSSVPSVTVDSTQASPKIPNGPLDEPEISIGEPTADERQKAQGIFDGDEDFIQKAKAAAWMGEEGPVRQRTLRAYMDLYDFKNQSVIAALRQVCTRLVFRAETQQVDRILVSFSNRWCDCNPNHGFKSTDVIHTMCYSIMLLNTDLHLADIDQKMTRSQFVKNTMTTIQSAVADSVPDAFSRASILPPRSGMLSPTDSDSNTLVGDEQDKPSWRASFKPPPRSESALGFNSDSPVDTCGPLVKAPFDGPMRSWEVQVEIVLKDVYNSIRDERLPLFGADPSHPPSQSQSGLSVMGMLKRTPSVLSKAPSEGQISVRGRINEAGGGRNQGGRWNSKSRSRPRFGGNGFSSSRTSFEDSNSIWSPAGSSATWSRYSLGRTQTSPSMDSFNSGYPYGDYQQSIGFANALSHAIIRDDYPIANSAQSVISEDFSGGNQMLEDESLELLGPPWVKEGIVIHKHHLDGVDKKAKDRNWNEVFAVVQKGTMSLFSFSTKSMRQKARGGRKHTAGAVVGGGNWQENATSMGSFSLRQTLASALPPPGYSRTRPHVWALSLPSGAVHLFQVGTPEISKEFVTTVNYWSARLSTHPLVGGISNIEYGWSDAVINNALIDPIQESVGSAQPQRPGSAAAGRTSMHSRQGSLQSSLRSSFDVGGNGGRVKLPGDRIHIAEWAPPSQSMRPSQCSEAEQLETLLAYVKSIENELQQHNQLRSPMLLAFTPRGHNAAKAMANWERKSSYLLREIVKFRTYVDCLHQGAERREEIYKERDVARRAANGEEILSDSALSGDEEGDVTLKAA